MKPLDMKGYHASKDICYLLPASVTEGKAGQWLWNWKAACARKYMGRAVAFLHIAYFACVGSQVQFFAFPVNKKVSGRASEKIFDGIIFSFLKQQLVHNTYCLHITGEPVSMDPISAVSFICRLPPPCLLLQRQEELCLRIKGCSWRAAA